MKTSASRANQLMREVVAATRLGQKVLARALLKELHQEDPDNEQALMWSAALAESQYEASGYLERVLAINPNNQQAINVLAMHRLNPAPARVPAGPTGSTPAASHVPQAVTPPPLVSAASLISTAAPKPVPPPANSFRIPDARPAAPSEISPVAPIAPAISPDATPPAPQPPAAPTPSVTTTAVPVTTPAVPTARVVNFSELLKKSWQCPVCQAQAAQPQRKCQACGSLLALDDLQALADNRGADEKTLTMALDRWLKRVTAEPAFEGWLNLARIYFNLNRSAEALPCLKKACELRPSETALQTVVARLEQRRLLMAVDDSMTLRRILGIMLERHGYRVLTASDGMQALALLNEQTPDLILLDITMPRMDGYQVCKVIKQNPYTKHVPVVMLSGNDGFFDKVKGKLAGATDYITKPFDETALAASVQKHLKAVVTSNSKPGR